MYNPANRDKYLKVVYWARKRYSKAGRLVLSVGGQPSQYTLVESAAFVKYMA